MAGAAKSYTGASKASQGPGSVFSEAPGKQAIIGYAGQ